MDLLGETVPVPTPRKRGQPDNDDLDPPSGQLPSDPNKKPRLPGKPQGPPGGKAVRKCFCGDDTVGRLRWCRHHKQVQDAMYYHFVDKPFGKKKAGDAETEAKRLEAKEQYKLDMSDDAHAVKMIQEFEKDNIGSKRFRKGVSWAEFTRSFETAVGERGESRARPVEKAEFIIRLVNKKGWSRTCTAPSRKVEQERPVEDLQDSQQKIELCHSLLELCKMRMSQHLCLHQIAQTCLHPRYKSRMCLCALRRSQNSMLLSRSNAEKEWLKAVDAFPVADYLGENG